ncbi:MAG: hypothetical protein V4631_20885 [Pseudomonadota bacterium]
MHYRATNTGLGFITNDDQLVLGLSFSNVGDDVWLVTGAEESMSTWASRVSAIALSNAEIKAIHVAAVWERIKAMREVRLDTGGYPAAGHWYNSDVRAKGEQSDLALQADELVRNSGDLTAQYVTAGVPVAWKTMDNGFVPMTGNLALAIRDAAREQTVKTYKAAATHQYFMTISADPLAYDFSTGWPAVYGE